MSRGTACEVHKHDCKVPQERHHIWPVGYHGPNIPDNLVLVCANGHGDIHYMLEALLKQKKFDTRDFGVGIRKYAFQGYEAVIAYGESLAQQIEMADSRLPHEEQE